MKERDELQEVQCEAEVTDAVLVNPEFAADVASFVKRGTSYRTILTWLETAIRKSHTHDNGFTQKEEAYYTNFMADWE